MHLRSYNSIKIIILDSKNLINGKYQYGIKSMKVEGVSKQVKLDLCKNKHIEKKLMEWKIYDASFSNFDVGVERDDQIKKTFEKTNELLSFVKNLKEQGPVITKAMEDSDLINVNVKKLEEFLDNMNTQVN